MRKKTAVTKETLQNIIFDAGIVYINYGLSDERILGATEGGNTFTVEREIREMEFDGLRGKTKGARRIISENATLTVNLKEITPENIKLALAGSEMTDTNEAGMEGTTHKEIRSTGKIELSDYIKNVAFVGTVSGTDKPVVAIVENALSDGGFEISAEDDNEVVIPIEFSAHYDPEDEEGKVPYAIRYPVID